ncbi:aminoglycoside phosphotransferase [Kitasatospora sp. MMS16-BH015]|uniref:phosphotransferase family protein n=1 Tax=Kitasatospora sp. MMS16-BH015 TaxID=2018025 RepID=UPI000CA1B665|nr:aminoglycoside phosphotransferase family protein [Kitasatospora sp. MMS16-BH015]AUG81100.1 aminoglycoside phosphotransferase [Kitasatospora sp. MMS16-BH015]
MNRTVTAVVTHEGDVLGEFGPFPVETRRWQDVGPVSRAVEAELGVPVLVLRLVSVEGGAGGQDGHVTYQVEAVRRPAAALAPTARELGDPLHRADWATAEGLRDSLGWAERELAAAGRPLTGPAEQIKTWNLSGIFRLPTAAGPAWLKHTPPFGACEAGVIELFGAVDPGLVPGLLGADSELRRVLLDHVPGEDCWGLPENTMLPVIERWVTAQAALAATAEQAAQRAGLPVRTPERLAEQASALLERELGLTPEELAAARQLVDGLPALAEELTDCGLPTTVLHGDFHPGNWRSDGHGTVVVDFSDACIGHPAFDGLRPAPFLSPERWAEVRDLWCAAWRKAAPGSDPERALALARPLMRIGYAVRYQEFLDNIEASERIYHEGDPAAELRGALRC